MAAPPESGRPVGGGTARSPASVAQDVIRQGSNLVREEVNLAKAELSENMSRLKTAIGEIVAGAVLLMVSLGILLAALVSALARLLVGIFGDETNDGVTVVPTDGLDATGTQIVTAVGQQVEVSLAAARTLPSYEALAALIVGAVFAIIGGVLLKNGLDKLSLDTLVPDRTARQVRKDAEMVSDRT